MAILEIEGDELVVTLQGADRLLALKRRIAVPLRCVRGATADPGMAREPKGWRGPGAHVPGVVVAGTFHPDGEKVFWDVRDTTRAVVVELQDHEYARLVVEVDDPAAVVRSVEQALDAR
ncbi:hypothetical protein EV189_1279 [Motilibacter rhizosphaerae]|uniref:Uncharacterized protein n=1 Tax=Motilibacter rhizosphaerae TaxID=598652 RepID=A0A4Q7NT06_9ACTN|nr:hypothetical protein [Motilibacter rhizosphaerae]RZS89512.1 hypothetical protein EV189_1279 [Motilibacter rhizosphaerae]